MKKIHSKSKYALTLSILSLIGAIAGLYIMNGLIHKQTVMAEEAAKKVLEVSRQKEREDELLQKVEENKDARSMLRGILVPKDEVVGFIEKIEGISDLSGADVVISSITADKNITAKIEAKGSWANTMRALMMIENMPFRITVSDVKLEKVSAGSESSSTGKAVVNTNLVWKVTFGITVPVIEKQ